MKKNIIKVLIIFITITTIIAGIAILNFLYPYAPESLWTAWHAKDFAIAKEITATLQPTQILRSPSFSCYDGWITGKGRCAVSSVIITNLSNEELKTAVERTSVTSLKEYSNEISNSNFLTFINSETIHKVTVNDKNKNDSRREALSGVTARKFGMIENNRSIYVSHYEISQEMNIKLNGDQLQGNIVQVEVFIKGIKPKK